MANGEGRGNCSPEGVTDNNSAVDASLLHEGGNGVGLTVGQNVLLTTDVGIAVTRAIDEQQLCPFLQLCPKREHRIVKAGAGTMNKDDWWQVWLPTSLNQDAIELESTDIGTDLIVPLWRSNRFRSNQREAADHQKHGGQAKSSIRHILELPRGATGKDRT